ncbi:MAG: tetratricopeptide repeat protein, partial [Acidobacteria bacterium]|nr:tetratricopeptide repeat protein [Acidobacteriota bacterium]
DFDRYYFDEARLSLEKAVEKDPDFALAYFYLTRVYQNLADAPRAEKALEQFKKLSRTGTAKGKDGLYITALSRLMEKDSEGYVRGLKDVIHADPRDKRALVDLAWFYKNQKKYAEAIPLFDKALEIDPAFGYAMNLLAYTYSEMGEKEKALKTFDRYAAAQPGDANPIDSMGDLYFLTGKFGAARAKYEQVLTIRPQFPSAWKLAYLYAMEGDYGQALQWADHLIAHAETDGIRAQGRQWKGFYYSLMGHSDEALRELDTAEALAKASGNFQLTDTTLRNALWTCYDWGRYDLYKIYLKKRLAYRAESKQATPTLNKIYEDLYMGLLDIKSGNVASARKKLEEILSLSASVGEKEKDFNLMAAGHLKREILFAEGAYGEAIRVFKDSPMVMIDLGAFMTVQQKNLPFQADFVARALLKKGETGKAIAEYERLVSPDAAAREKALVHPFSRIRLAALYEAKGDLDRAVEQYEIAVKGWKGADPGLPEVAAARKKLTLLKARTTRPKGASVDAFYSSPFYVAPNGLLIP